jgi:phosphinothricin acetyltransferase
MKIRVAESGDLHALVTIYNHYVSQTHITFDTEPFAVGARTQWFTQFAASGAYRLLVGVVDKDVIGYASSTQFKPKPAYSTSVETTIYIHPEHLGQGFGRTLYGALVDKLTVEPAVHRAYGGVALPNPQSIALHEGLGFKQVATYHEVGFKFGKYWDVIWFEKEV